MEDKLINEYLPLVKGIAKNYKNSGIPEEDLIQEGLIALWEAHSKFDQKRNVKFTTFATHLIRNRILNIVTKEQKHTRATGSLNEEIEIESDKEPTAQRNIKLPAELTDIERKVLVLLFGFDGKGQRDLTETAKELHISRERVRQLKEKAIRRLKSLNPKLTESLSGIKSKSV
jgi:RNA polymerase sigma factor (sigma-70 family)